MKQKTTAKMIGENIRRLRLQYGETQEELGELIGYGATTVANYESGYRMPDLETFFYDCRALSCITRRLHIT